jgi:hypothetical protein
VRPTPPGERQGEAQLVAFDGVTNETVHLRERRSRRTGLDDAVRAPPTVRGATGPWRHCADMCRPVRSVVSEVDHGRVSGQACCGRNVTAR